MLIGYARISTDTQVLDQQIDALIKYGVDERNIYKEQISTRIKFRPEYDKAISFLRTGDSFVFCKLDRPARSVKELNELYDFARFNNINLISLDGHIDTTTATGKLIFQYRAANAEFELNIISERTKEALAALKKRGVRLGRPFILSLEQKQQIDSLLLAGSSKCEIKRAIGVKSTTPIYNYLKNRK